ncbi:MAG: septal ring lytic transglycosylase RlpA family protein [Acidobacteria bacterium]|nr:septal ring lytic transglycosylase RlpA family protein [Acidobacteriota bacterium]
MRRFLALSMVVLALLLAGVPAMAAFQLVLKNGRVLTGDDLEREPGKYVLIRDDGRRLTIEMDQVAELRILGDDVVMEDTPAPDTAAEDEEKPPPGVTVAGGDLSNRLTRSEPTTVGGSDPPEKPAARAQNLTGPAPGAPLAPGEWRPESDWPKNDPDWPTDGWISRGPDPTWTPQSDFATDPKANEFNPSTWSKPARDPTWHPTDGFRKTNTSLKVTTATTGTGVGSKSASVVKSGLKVPRSAGAPAAPGLGSTGSADVVEGNAAWYGEAYRGRTTASGRAFDPDQLTAAHASLPFGTLVLVTRQDEPARSVVVEIIDRGAGDRLLNLSRGAAVALDMLKIGVAPVRMEPLPAAAKPSRAGKPSQTPEPDEAKEPKSEDKDATPEASPTDGS